MVKSGLTAVDHFAERRSLRVRCVGRTRSTLHARLQVSTDRRSRCPSDVSLQRPIKRLDGQLTLALWRSQRFRTHLLCHGIESHDRSFGRCSRYHQPWRSVPHCSVFGRRSSFSASPRPRNRSGSAQPLRRHRRIDRKCCSLCSLDESDAQEPEVPPQWSPYPRRHVSFRPFRVSQRNHG